MIKLITYIGTRGVHRGTHGVGEQVELPAQSLHEKHTKEGVDRRLLEDIVIVSDMG